MLGLIRTQTVWPSDGIPKRIFQKSWFWKKSADDKKGFTQKAANIPPKQMQQHTVPIKIYVAVVTQKAK